MALVPPYTPWSASGEDGPQPKEDVDDVPAPRATKAGAAAIGQTGVSAVMLRAIMSFHLLDIGAQQGATGAIDGIVDEGHR